MGQAMSNLISCSQPCFEQGTGARWHPPNLHRYLIWCHLCMDREAQVGCRSCTPIIAMPKLMCCSVRSWWTHKDCWESSLFRSPGKTYLLTSEAKDWQNCAAGCFGYVSRMNAVTQPGYAEGKRQHLCLLWYTAGVGMQDGLYFYQRTS